MSRTAFVALSRLPPVDLKEADWLFRSRPHASGRSSSWPPVDFTLSTNRRTWSSLAPTFGTSLAKPSTTASSPAVGSAPRRSSPSLTPNGPWIWSTSSANWACGS